MTDIDAFKRPSVYDVLQNELLPPKLEDEYFKEALKVISGSENETIYHKKLIEALFKNQYLV